MSAQLLYHPAAQGTIGLRAFQMATAVPPPLDIRTPRPLEWGYRLINHARLPGVWSKYDALVCAVFNVWFTTPYLLWWLWGCYRGLALPLVERAVWWTLWAQLAPWHRYGDMQNCLWPDLV